MTYFLDIDDEYIADSRYIARPVLYVEGRSDKELFADFFLDRYLDRIDIKTPPLADGSGCQGVLKRVQTERRDNLSVFGLVDGETLIFLGEYDLFLNIIKDDVIVQCAHNLYSWIYFIPAWEIENILLTQDLLIKKIFTVKCKGVKYNKSISDILQEEVNRSSILSALYDTFTELGLEHIRINHVYAISDPRQARDKMICLALDKNPGVTQQEIEQAETIWQERFNQITNMDHLLRAVDGKALLARLRQRCGLEASFERSLAERIAEIPNIQNMFQSFIDAIAPVSPSRAE